MIYPVIWWPVTAEIPTHTNSCAWMLTHMLRSYDCVHYANFTQPSTTERAVIIIHGQVAWTQNVLQAIHILNEQMSKMKGVILISIGDETCEFPYALLQHSNLKLWLQTAKPGVVKASRYLIEGFPELTPERLAQVGDVERDLDWSFAGQICHSRRVEMVEVLRKLRKESLSALIETSGFQQGLPILDYLKLLKRTKVAPCPSGAAVDSFRVYEALESGCIPVLDAHTPDEIDGYWTLVFGQGHPFTVIHDWFHFPTVLDRLLERWPKGQAATQAFWAKYKSEFMDWLAEDWGSL